MENEKKVSEKRKPDFVNFDGISIWKNIDKNKKEYLSVKIALLDKTFNCYPIKEEASK